MPAAVVQAAVAVVQVAKVQTETVEVLPVVQAAQEEVTQFQTAQLQ